ncbi:LysR family transcriptional regulator [Nocardioides acrostichi]|uniref:LysR family transcriptional regulator n=1 Tax=Nocardioides acrostichi TaxID=2784339 RepID=A0A930Y9D0_9ACTN|nr:LysR family transcriptional regulator [Nocardioides acrostichi]MBF4160223.1 LysR family transcriptional regulator [Nocardioides acrostichi]
MEQLEYVEAVARHGSLRRAGEQLHLSQPALSEALTKLERELGVTLVDRRRSGSRISRQGQELMPHLLEVLDAVERMRCAAGDATATLRTLRVGTVGVATGTLLAPAVRSFQEATPETTVEICALQQEEIDEALLDGSLDMGLVTVADEARLPHRLAETVLVRGATVAVLAGEDPLAAQPDVELDALHDAPFVAMRQGYLMHRVALSLLGGRLPAVCHHADGAEMGKVMVGGGLGRALLPDFSVLGDPMHRAGHIVTRPLAGSSAPEVRLTMRHRAGAPTSAPVSALAGLLVREARNRKDEPPVTAA